MRGSRTGFVQAGAVDILALGAQSRSLLQRALIGETALRLLEAPTCDLLIVKQPGFQCPIRPQSAGANI